MQIDVLNTPQTAPKGRGMLKALYSSGKGLDIRWVESGPIRPNSWLVLYGLGGPDRVMHATRERLIAFDLGYWERYGDRRKYRAAIGGFHSPQLIMLGPKPDRSRWLSSGLQIAQSGGDKRGPILLVGNAPKSIAIGAGGWAAAKSGELRQRFKGRSILYRPKPGKPPEQGIDCDGIATEDIEQLLKKCSLVVCRHSNVAVDACRLGVPVVCDDGAAAAIYPQSLDEADMQPDMIARTEFLHRLAWWQWNRQECEAGEFWRWFRTKLENGLI